MNNNPYPFLDTIRNDRYIPEWIPTSAMYYDGLLIEGVIEGYQTLSVTGREMVSVSVESESVQIGSIITNQTLPSRTLTVKYKLEDWDSEELLKKFDDLKRYLYRTKDVPIQFNDELDYTYFGRLSSSETVTGDTNSIISSFDIYCADPRKYSKQYKSTGLIATYTPYETVPDIVKVIVSKGTTVTVINGKKKMSITNSNLKKGDIVEFRPNKGDVLVNGVERTAWLSWADSYLEDFFIKKGDKITSNDGSIEILYRVAML